MGMEHRVAAGIGQTTTFGRADWVMETRFGRWFLGTGIWRKYVLAEALDTLTGLAGSRVRPDCHVLDLGVRRRLAGPSRAKVGGEPTEVLIVGERLA